MMRIAIAGGGGFAYILAGEIAQTANALLVLSTRVSTRQATKHYPISIPSYSNLTST